MADDKLGQFNVMDYLKAQGAELQNVDESGNYVVNYKGQQGIFDPHAVIKQAGMDPSKVDVQFNTPQTALDTSPVSVSDRFGIGSGNTEGTVNYLKTKFEDAQVDPSGEKGIVVKNKGVWQQVDPSFFGNADPWAVTKALKKDFMRYNDYLGSDHDVSAAEAVKYVKANVPYETWTELAKQGVNAIKGAYHSLTKPGAGKELLSDVAEGVDPTIRGALQTAGAFYGGPQGAALAGGVGSIASHTLGKYWGTYQATPAQELFDTVLDASIAGFAEKIVPGSRAKIQDFDSALKGLQGEAADGTKDLLAAGWEATGAGSAKTFRRILDNPVGYIAERLGIREAAGATTAPAVIAKAEEQQVGLIKRVAAAARDRLPKQFGKMLAAVGEKAEENGGLVIDPEKHIIAPINEAIQEIGQFVLQDVGETVTDSLENKVVSSGTKQLIFKPAEGMSGTFPPKAMEEIQKEMPTLARALNALYQQGPQKGKAAVEVTKLIEKNLNIQLLKESGNHNYASLLNTTIKDAFTNGVMPVFEKVGLAGDYQAANTYYRTGVRALERVESDLGTKEGPLNLIKNYFTKGNGEGQAAVNKVFSLLENTGAQLLDSFHMKQAVKETAPIFKGNFLSGVAAATMTLGQSIPRLVATEATLGVSAARKVGTVLKALDQNTLQKVLQNPALFETLVRPAVSVYGVRDQIHNQIMQGIGNKLSGGGQQQQ